MKQTSKNFLKSFSFSAGANIVSMIVSALVVLIVPKSISTEGYGYYQLYILYIGYAGFFQFGIIDGVYLRYGGAYYNELDDRIRNCFYSGAILRIRPQVIRHNFIWR